MMSLRTPPCSTWAPNGRIIPLALDAYDTDGLQGIYCQETSASWTP
ncbi:MAG: conjugative transposon protein TraM [Bacteroidales bacterium]|nr:conjugative transposon protein TraM [Bacteroidales bacterium]